ncbi:hypothetical protein BSNK01_10970 [Bacillaceae bacterium]
MGKRGWKDDALIWGGLRNTPRDLVTRGKALLNPQESAEAIVREYGTPENGRAEPKGEKEPIVRTVSDDSRKPRKRAAGGRER